MKYTVDPLPDDDTFGDISNPLLVRVEGADTGVKLLRNSSGDTGGFSFSSTHMGRAGAELLGDFDAIEILDSLRAVLRELSCHLAAQDLKVVIGEPVENSEQEAERRTEAEPYLVLAYAALAVELEYPELIPKEI